MEVEIVKMMGVLLIPILIVSFIIVAKNKAKKRAYEIEVAAIREEERKKEWLQKMKWHRFNVWWQSVTDANEIISINSIVPQGFVAHPNEAVLLANRDCHLYESRSVYSTSISGMTASASESYEFKDSTRKVLHAPNIYMGLVSDSTTVTNTIGTFTAVATTRAFQEKQLIATGTLIVTNKRVIFLGDHQNRSYKMEQVLDCNSDEFYLSVAAEGNEKQMIFEVFDAAIFKGIINLVRSNYRECQSGDFPVISLPRELPKPPSNPSRRMVIRKNRQNRRTQA